MPISTAQSISEAVPEGGAPSANRGPGASYGQILRSSSIVGGAEGLNYLIGMVRTKLVAMLLGPAGVGLVGLYQSATALVGVVTGLGVSGSGVREVAEAHAGGDPLKMAAIVKTLRRICWLTGGLGWLITALLSWPLSQWAFQSTGRAGAIALLGATLLLTAVGGGQGAVLQGTRRIGDLVRAGVLGNLGGTTAAVAMYAWLGEKGIVPVLLTTAAINLALAWWFARGVGLVQVSQSWAETMRNARRLVGFGVALMWGGLCNAALGLGLRGLIVRNLGLEANGIYQSAWGISGMFAGFILTAMGTDFYPRLTSVAQDNREVNRLVNEQTEIGILIALPGLLGTLTFAPWLMHLFYTAKFLPGAELLPWFVLGVFGRVISWPLGYIQLAKGASRWFAATETAFAVLQFVAAMVLLRWMGLPGVALAFALVYLCYPAGMLWVTGRLSEFRWSPAVIRLLAGSGGLIAGGFAAEQWLPEAGKLIAGGLITLVSGVVCLRGLARRLGPEHRLVRMLDWGMWGKGRKAKS